SAYTASMQLVWMSTNGTRSRPVSTMAVKYTAMSAATARRARRGTPPASAPTANHFGRSPSRPSEAVSFANAPTYRLSTPTTMMAEIDATATGPMPGAVAATISSSGTSVDPALSPSTPIVTTCSERYAAPTARIAIAVARGIVRRGLRNSPAMWVTASHLATAHTNRLIAAPTPTHPYGINGSKLS